MPPKKGKKKQVDDDWEAELGETLDAPPADDPVSPPTTAAVDEDEEGGGLMSQLGKSKKVTLYT